MTRLSVITIVLCALIWFALSEYQELTAPDVGSNAGTAVAFEVLGQNNTSARLITGLAGFLMALFAMFVTRQLYGTKAGLYAFLMCISYFMVVFLGHYLTLDMLLSSLIFIAIGCLLIAQSQRRHTRHVRNWMLAGWVALSLATLTKGPLALMLPAAALFVYSLWQRDWGIWPSLHTGKGLIVCLLMTTAWLIAARQLGSESTSFFYVYENLQRYSSETPGQASPIYYYLPFLLVGLCPWIWTSSRTLFKPDFAWRPLKPGSFQPERFMWVFVVTTLVCFSLAPSKLPGDILPVFPVIAVMAAARLATLGVANIDRWAMWFIGLFAIFVALDIGHLTFDGYPVSMWLNHASWILSAGILYLIAAAFLAFRPKRPMLQITVAAVLSLASANLIMASSGELGEGPSHQIVASVVVAKTPTWEP